LDGVCDSTNTPPANILAIKDALSKYKIINPAVDWAQVKEV